MLHMHLIHHKSYILFSIIRCYAIRVYVRCISILLSWCCIYNSCRETAQTLRGLIYSICALHNIILHIKNVIGREYARIQIEHSEEFNSFPVVTWLNSIRWHTMLPYVSFQCPIILREVIWFVNCITQSCIYNQCQIKLKW